MLTSLLLLAAATAAPMGYYTVPVTPDLRPYAHFDLSCAKLTTTPSGYHLEYDLPPELVDAASQHVVLDEVSREPGFVVMQGLEGRAHCLDASDHFSCLVSYLTMKIDQTAVQAYIDHRYTEPTERATRAIVARTFGGEPAGIIEVPKPHE